MKTVTMEQVIAWHPGYLLGEDSSKNYTPARIRELFAGREVLTTRDIAALDKPAENKVWALLHSEFLTDRQFYRLACEFIERASTYQDNPHLDNVIVAGRAWLHGAINDDEMSAIWQENFITDALMDSQGEVTWDHNARKITWSNSAREIAEITAVLAAHCSLYTHRDTAWETETQWQLTRILEEIYK